MAMWNCDLCKIQEPFHYAIACMNEAKAKLKVKTKENIINMYERYEIPRRTHLIRKIATAHLSTAVAWREKKNGTAGKQNHYYRCQK